MATGNGVFVYSVYGHGMRFRLAGRSKSIQRESSSFSAVSVRSPQPPHGNRMAYVPVSILHKSISGHHRPVRVGDGPMTARCRFT